MWEWPGDEASKTINSRTKPYLNLKHLIANGHEPFYSRAPTHPTQKEREWVRGTMHVRSVFIKELLIRLQCSEHDTTRF